ncbi:LysR substrate-binding domain-containing protein, partial [Xanthomonas arboricola]|uniref:LysR substrate-binding domain-containing protein n=1 Tax=Xanthomonas arboricola TaxID=56448 RepID=UPI0021571437
PPAVAQIKHAYPQVSVHLQQAAESAALDLLSQGDADIAVVSTAGGSTKRAWVWVVVRVSWPWLSRRWL